MASGHVRIELREVVVGATHRLRAEGDIPLSAFLNQKMKFGGKFQLNTPSGEPFAGIDYEIEAQIPFDNAASLYMTKMNASGYKMKQSDSLASDGAENTLIIRILRGENFESVFEDELPSCYCLYTFYIYQNQEQFKNLILSKVRRVFRIPQGVIERMTIGKTHPTLVDFVNAFRLIRIDRLFLFYFFFRIFFQKSVLKNWNYF